MPPLHRRAFLGLTGAAGAGVAAAIAGFSSAPAWADPSFADNPFTLGIASGDPHPDGVVLWTRLAPDPLAVDGSGGMPARVVPVLWQVAEDEQFRQVVRAGEELATPELGHSVHAEVTGLRPDREYYYRFRVGTRLSPVGRTRTAPAYDADRRHLAFGFVSCQNLPAGHFTAYRHLAEEDLDLVLHLGDYIYEGPGASAIGRPHLPATEIFSLSDYRIRHAQYKTDPDLQLAHARFPWAVTWDDHEVENNYADEVSEDRKQSQESFRQRRAVAYQAYYEHMPLRRMSIPHGPDMQLYRRLRYGNLAEFNILDGRQYRSDQVPTGMDDPSRTMLGSAQEQWLLDGLAASTARWNVLGNQTVIAEADRDPGPGKKLSDDNWNGYAAARQRLFDGVVERGVQNMVVVTGDAHCSMVADLKQNFDDQSSRTVGVEFLGTSITSGGNGSDMDTRGTEWLASNPHMRFYNGRRGYVRCQLDQQQWRTEYRVLPYVTDPGAPVSTRASFVVENGRPGVQVDVA
ncbi:alkaline phosphatase D family protein [Micromonospora sp. DR5-3]|uniref:alkaline phosphatase D family protein n=1 Tax=unclassified Micromonospora TaxID=2617518 RepID=UPI0011D5A3F4|nr:MULTISPECIES: alkaline phosphatase D family protein [unclassified Micromonospora]MCW3819102.1 alkaline phosphatase D family protein [Micromonospora sp. DR5-3]TYC19522.1 alkaline phosphatase [Micromonospora sp. MP36]